MSDELGAGLRIAVVGLEFGAEFVPIYADHPDVAEVIVCDLDEARCDRVAEQFGIRRRTNSLDDLLELPDIDAVHLVTGLADHGRHTVAALQAGKHVACTVPMALTFEDIEAIVAAQRESGLVYMMMETAVYTREFLLAQELHRAGRFGAIGYARGVHFQDMTGWPGYWDGLPPMHYATHAVSPILALLDARADEIHAFGSGRLPDGLTGRYDNPFPIESAIVTVADQPVVIDLTRSLFSFARAYTEAFSIYGDQASFEWPQLEATEEPVLFTMDEPTDKRGRPVHTERLTVPDRADLLPESIRRYTTRFVYGDSEHLSFVQGGGHGGSHPHLVHEYVRSIVEGRRPFIDVVAASNWTATGIAAHESALRNGAAVKVPELARPLPTDAASVS